MRENQKHEYLRYLEGHADYMEFEVLPFYDDPLERANIKYQIAKYRDVAIRVRQAWKDLNKSQYFTQSASYAGRKTVRSVQYWGMKTDTEEKNRSDKNKEIDWEMRDEEWKKR